MTAQRVTLAVSLAALAVLLGSFAGPRTPVEPVAVVIRDARVFDGERVWPRASVVLRDGLIEAFGETVEAPAGAQVIDGTGHTLLPGLIDSHVHAWGDARRDALRFGVTTELDMFTDAALLPEARRARGRRTRTDEADLWSAGTLATVPGGHGTEFGQAVSTLTGPAEAASWVAARKAEGSDYVKIVREDLHVYGGGQRFPTLDAPTEAALVRAAHAQGLKALVHASAQAQAQEALRDGADGLVHVFQDEAASEDTVALARHAFVVPTLTVIAGFAGEPDTLGADPRISPFLAPAQAQTLAAHLELGPPESRLLANARESVRRLRAAHVPLLAGTDAPNPHTAHGASLHGELAQLVAAGLTPVESLAAATSVPATQFGLSDRGRIGVGLRADLVLVEGDPTIDITATRSIIGIWKNGYAVQREPGRQTPARTRLEPGPLSDFETSRAVDGGLRWLPTTDEVIGGHSVTSLTLVPEGAAGSHGALRLTGEIRPGFSWPWAGALLRPGAQPMEPVDASGCTALEFWARGDGREYSVLLFSGPAQGAPSAHRFRPGPAWARVTVPLAGFAGADLHQLRGLALTAGLPTGPFQLDVDGVEVR